MRALAWAVAACALLAIGLAAWQLESASDGLRVSRERLGTMPLTVYRPRADAPAGAAPGAEPAVAPVVVIAHGFAGSQQLMQPFAVTLARNGYVAVTFDFPGHGRNPAPMRGGLTDQDASRRTLLTGLDTVAAFARGLAGSDGRLALVGHSMASDLVVRHAQAHREVQATVAVSLFAPSIQAATPLDSPRNLLVIDGALEPALLATEALRVVGRGAPDGAGPAQPRVTYGRFEDGTARRADIAPGVEHIGVLYSAHTLRETLAWLDAAFGRGPHSDGSVSDGGDRIGNERGPFVDARGRWLGLLLAGVVALAWPLSRTLPRVAPDAPGPPSPRLPWRRFWTLALMPALVTPLLLWKMPSDFLPILLGDYLLLHFGLYGLLTVAAVRLAGHRIPWPATARRSALAGTTALVATYAMLAVGVPIDRYVFNVFPEPVRVPLVAALCAGTLPWFLADEWLTRDASAPPAAYLVTKLCFLLSLVLAILLNPPKLFFLAIIVPAILLLFVVYGLFSRWVHRRTGHPAVAAIANALAFGCFIAVTFPLVD